MGTPSVSAAEWAQWRRRMFGDPYLVWHDGPDFTSLLDAARSDARLVADMLAAGIRVGDSLAPESVTVLTFAGLAPVQLQAPMRTAIAAASGTFRVRLAQALRALTADDAWADAVVPVLATGAHWGQRMDAAIALTEFAPSPQLIQALGRAVCDPQYLVRYHAANTLVRYAKGSGRVDNHPELLAKLQTQTRWWASAAARRAWRDAADELVAAALRKLRR